jgi:hypothetical protein
MEPFLLPQFNQLQVLCGTPVIVYHAAIESEAVRIVYECLRTIGPTKRLNLVLSTLGGIVASARRLALLLHEFTEDLTILVPYQARSAGTLLCLSANELILGPMVELGAIDTLIGSTGTPPSETPSLFSAEDVRAFGQMAQEWFGVHREKDHLHVLALMAQRVFPPSLSSFYRSDRMIRRVASELVAYQLPDVEEQIRQHVVHQLVRGYDAHDHCITRSEAQALGLQVSFPSPEEETVLWDLLRTMQRQ